MTVRTVIYSWYWYVYHCDDVGEGEVLPLYYSELHFTHNVSSRVSRRVSVSVSLVPPVLCWSPPASRPPPTNMRTVRTERLVALLWLGTTPQSVNTATLPWSAVRSGHHQGLSTTRGAGDEADVGDSDSEGRWEVVEPRSVLVSAVLLSCVSLCQAGESSRGVVNNSVWQSRVGPSTAS